MNNKEFRQALIENNWMSPIRGDCPYPVSIDELQCQHCDPEVETLTYEERFSTRIACRGCGRIDEIDERAFVDHTWSRDDRDRYLSSVLHTPTLERRVDDEEEV
jgi:hypothetical protein